MHIAHSNIAKQAQPEIKERTADEQFAYEMLLKACKRVAKRRQEDIKLIREVFPGWELKINE